MLMIGCNMTQGGVCVTHEVQSVFLKQIYESSKCVFIKKKSYVCTKRVFILQMASGSGGYAKLDHSTNE